MPGQHEVPAPALASHAPAPAPAASPGRVSQDNVVTKFLHNPLLSCGVAILDRPNTHTNNGACSFLTRQSPQPGPRLGAPLPGPRSSTWPPPPGPCVVCWRSCVMLARCWLLQASLHTASLVATAGPATTLHSPPATSYCTHRHGETDN